MWVRLLCRINRPMVAAVVLAGLLTMASDAASAGDAEAIEFARTHYPDLADLMQRLQQRSPAEFQKAVRDVERVRLRIERMKDDSPRRAEELERWTLRSRIQVESARLASHRRKPGGAAAEEAASRIEARLQALAEEWVAFEERRLRQEAEMLEAQLSRVREQQSQIAADRGAAVEKAYRRSVAAAEAAARRARANAKRSKSNTPADTAGGKDRPGT